MSVPDPERTSGALTRYDHHGFEGYLGNVGQIFGLTGRIQGFFATYELPILVFALVLLLLSLSLATRNVMGSCPLPERSRPTDGPNQEKSPH